MKVYIGDRTIDGAQVLVDGRPLQPWLDLRTYTRNGFEWSYEGPEPRQLALALLMDHTGDPHTSLAMTEAFMCAVVAKLGNEWEMTSGDIAASMAGLDAASGSRAPA